MKFTSEGEVVASGTKIELEGTQDLEGFHCLIMHERPDEEIPVKLQTIQMWHQRLGHLNKRDIINV